MAVNYNKDSISIGLTNDQANDITVYAHPKDKIDFDFDISKLRKEVVGGDLVIHLLNGHLLTLVNFGIMALDGSAPELHDITGQAYDAFDLFEGRGYKVDDSLSKYVVSRQISGPDSLLPPGKDLASSQNIANGTDDQANQVGDLFTPEQNIIPEFGPQYMEFITRTLLHQYNYTNDVAVTFSSNDVFTKQEDYDNIYPVKLVIINPKIAPEYGAYSSTTSGFKYSGGVYDSLQVVNGGGSLLGNDNAHYMYDRQLIDYSNNSDPIYYDRSSDPNNNLIFRKFHISIANKLVNITHVSIYGLPDGVSIVTENQMLGKDGQDGNLVITPAGQGNYDIDVKGAQGDLDLILQYPAGLGGPNGLFSNVRIEYNGINIKSGDLVRGSTSTYFDFAPVNGPNDVKNNHAYNTYTFSTNKDPLHFVFTSQGDKVHGDDTNSIYDTGGGDDEAWGGTGTEQFNLGSSNNIFHSYIGNDFVDGGSDNLSTLDINNTIVSGKNVKVTVDSFSSYGGIVLSGTGFNSQLFDFKTVNFKGDTQVVRDDNLYVRNTNNFITNVTVNMGAGNNAVNLNVASTINTLGANILITTGSSTYGVIVNDVATIHGSVAGGDVIKGGNDNVGLHYVGVGAGNRADYSAVTLDLTYDASTGLVTKEEATRSGDVVQHISEIDGGRGKNTFNGAVGTSIKYVGQDPTKDTLSYFNLAKHVDGSNGVKVDFATSQVTKLGDNTVDSFVNISNITTTDNDDTVILADNNSYNIDGLGGTNTLDYSETSYVLNVDLQQGRVSKGENGAAGFDTINHFTHIIGTKNNGDNFKMTGDVTATNNSSYIIEGNSSGGGFINSVDYSAVTANTNLTLDLTTNTNMTVSKDTGGLKATDKLSNIQQFTLGGGNNTIYMYNASQVNFSIDGGSGSSTIDFSKMTSALNINFATDFQNISNVQTLNLTNYDDNVILTNNVAFTTINAGLGVNKLDLSQITAGITANLNLSGNAELTVGVAGHDVKLIDFEQYTSTNYSDTYNLTFSLDDANIISAKNYIFDGNGGENTLNFTGVKHANPINTKGLKIDLSNNTVTDIETSKTVLKFSHFQTVIGSDDNDVFVLPITGAAGLSIDGGGGDNNIVSYETYTTGQVITSNTISSFKNIQGIKGSQASDQFNLTDSNTDNGVHGGRNLSIDGNVGFNVINYTGAMAGDVAAVVGANSIIVSKGTDGSKDTITHGGDISFKNATGTFGVNYTVNTADNRTIGSKKSGTTPVYELFLEGGTNAAQRASYKVDYSNVGANLTLDLDLQSGLNGEGTWISVNKGMVNAGDPTQGENIDYVQYIGEITLANNKANTVNVYDSTAYYGGTLKINGGTGTANNTLSFQQYHNALTIDAAQAQIVIGSTTLNYTNFTSFIGSDLPGSTDIFIAKQDGNYSFNGLNGDNVYDARNLTGGATTTVSLAIGGNPSGQSTNNNKIVVTKDNAGNVDTVYAVNKYVGKAEVTSNISINDYMSFDMSFDSKGGANSSISYNYDSTATGSMIFDASTGVITKAGGAAQDTVTGFTKWTGSQGNDTFIAVDPTAATPTVKVNSYDGGGGDDSIDFSNIKQNLTFILANTGIYTAAYGVGATPTNFATLTKFNTIYGSATNTNTFKLDGLLAAGHPTTLSLVGNNGAGAGNSIVDLSGVTVSTGKITYLDPSASMIYVGGTNVDPTGLAEAKVFTVSGISEIILGNGDNELDLSVGMSQSGWTHIVGGTGINSVSFRNSGSGINYDISGVAASGATLDNFNAVSGTGADDKFFLLQANVSTSAKTLNGLGGTNTLDYSDLTLGNELDLTTGKITRHDGTTAIVDNISNFQIFNTGKGASTFTSIYSGNYTFNAQSQDAGSANQNTLSYAGVTQNLFIYYDSQEVIKGSNVDTFANIFDITGGEGDDVFMFSTVNMGASARTVKVNGGGGTNNSINLSYLNNSITYTTSTGIFTTGNITVNLISIQSIIGTGKGDTFIVDSNVTNFTFHGGIIASGANVTSTIDFTNAGSAVTVNMQSRSITYGANTDNFQSINAFIGASVGNNKFLALNSTDKYTIIGKGTGNEVDYSNASTAINIGVVGGTLNIDKGTGIQDSLTNIQKLTLTSFTDTVTLASAADIAALTGYSIDGGVGDYNIVNLNFTDTSSLLVNLDTSKITVAGGSAQNFSLINFQDWNFGNQNAAYTLTAKTGTLSLHEVNFGTGTGAKTLDLSNISEGVSITNSGSDKNGTITGNTSGNVLQYNNMSVLTLGSGANAASAIQYSLNVTSYNINNLFPYSITSTSTTPANTPATALMALTIGNLTENTLTTPLTITPHNTYIEVGNNFKLTGFFPTQININNSNIQSLVLSMANIQTAPTVFNLNNTAAGTSAKIQVEIGYNDTLNIGSNGILSDASTTQGFTGAFNTNNLTVKYTAGTSIVNLTSFQNTNLNLIGLGTNKTTLNISSLPLINGAITWNLSDTAGRTTGSLSQNGANFLNIDTVDTYTVANHNNTFIINNQALIGRIFINGAIGNNTNTVELRFASTDAITYSATNLTINAQNLSVANINSLKIDGTLTGDRNFTVTSTSTLKTVDFGWNLANAANSSNSNVSLNVSAMAGVSMNIVLTHGTSTAMSAMFSNTGINPYNYSNMKLLGSTITFGTGNNNIVMSDGTAGTSLGNYFAGASTTNFVTINAGTGNNSLDMSSLNVANSVLKITYDTNGVVVLTGTSAATNPADPTLLKLTNIQTIRWDVTQANAATNGALITINNTASQNINLYIGNLNSMTLNNHTAMETNFDASNTTYYSRIDYSGVTTAITGQLFLNSNNLSTFSRNGHTDTIEGFNYIHGSSTNDKFYVHNIAGASPFSIVMAGGVGTTTKIDFSSIKDPNHTYNFVAQDPTNYTPTGYQTGALFGIYEDDANHSHPAGTKFYGQFKGASNITLTAGNDVFHPSFSLSKNYNNPAGNPGSGVSTVDGGGGIDTISLSDFGSANFDYVLAQDGTGIGLNHANVNGFDGPAFNNFSILEGAIPNIVNNPTNYIKLNWVPTQSINAGYTQNFDVVRPKDSSGAEYWNSWIILSPVNAGNEKYNVLFTGSSEVVTSDGNTAGGAAGNMSLTGINFAINDLGNRNAAAKAASFNLTVGSYLDLSHLGIDETINITSKEATQNITFAQNLNYTYSQTDSKTIVITSNTAGQHTLTLHSNTGTFNILQNNIILGSASDASVHNTDADAVNFSLYSTNWDSSSQYLQSMNSKTDSNDFWNNFDNNLNNNLNGKGVDQHNSSDNSHNSHANASNSNVRSNAQTAGNQHEQHTTNNNNNSNSNQNVNHVHDDANVAAHNISNNTSAKNQNAENTNSSSHESSNSTHAKPLTNDNSGHINDSQGANSPTDTNTNHVHHTADTNQAHVSPANFNLSAILEAAKGKTANNNDNSYNVSNQADDMHASLMHHGVHDMVVNTYQHDEANSMSYSLNSSIQYADNTTDGSVANHQHKEDKSHH